MSAMLSQNLLYLALDGTNSTFVHSLPINQIPYFITVAHRQHNATGMTVQPFRCSDSGKFGALESPRRYFQLVMEFHLIVIYPTLTGLPGQQVRNRFNPGPIPK